MYVCVVGCAYMLPPCEPLNGAHSEMTGHCEYVLQVAGGLEATISIYLFRNAVEYISKP